MFRGGQRYLKIYVVIRHQHLCVPVRASVDERKGTSIGEGGLMPHMAQTGFTVRELAPTETHDLRRRVSAAGRINLPTWDHELDEAPGSWHLGAVDSKGRVVAISTFFREPCPNRPEVSGAYRLQFMAVEPSLQREGLGTLVLTEALRRLRASGVSLLWATARPEAVPFYQRFGFSVNETANPDRPVGLAPQPVIVLELGAQSGH